MAGITVEELRQENGELRLRLEEAESTIRAISSGEVDAFLVRSEAAGDHVLTLGGVDRPYRLLIERMLQGAATLTADGTIFYVNRRLADLLEIPLDEMIGARLTDYVAEPDRAGLENALRLALTEDIYREVSVRRGEGVFPASVTANPLLVENMICVLLTDLTERKRQEEERERFLEEQVARVAAESAASALRDADRRKDEFLAILAHELRNPLGPLRNGIHLLGLVGSLEPLAKETHEMMARQVENLVHLVDDLLDVGRVTRGMVNLRKETIDARLVIHRAVESCRDFIAQRDHRLEIDLPPYALPIEVDLLRMTQVMVNLLKNAAKFTPKAGKIHITAERTDESSAAIHVRDNGRGIEPKALAEIFDLFVQADSTPSRTEEGLGIGLTLSRHLTELHGGTLLATSEGLNRGSEFVISIPLAAEKTSVAKRPSVAAPRLSGKSSSPRRILIVDDNLDAAGSLSLLLRLAGHEVREAHDGARAIDVATKFHPDLIFLDIGLPGMDGYQVVRRLRADPDLDAVRVVALSGYGSELDRDRSRAAGFDDHLVKPAEVGVLETILATLPPATDPVRNV